MNTLQEIKKAVKGFSRKEFDKFSEWFIQYEQDAWDKQIEDDAKSGKLDHIADRVLKDFKAGRCKEL